jgi:hypothetical protein
VLGQCESIPDSCEVWLGEMSGANCLYGCRTKPYSCPGPREVPVRVMHEFYNKITNS